MADGVGYTPGVGLKVATRDVPYSGEAMQAQVVGLVTFSGPDDAKLAVDVSPENRLPVDASTITTKFRDAFEVYDPVNGPRWRQTLANGDLVLLKGDTVAASYLTISKSPLDAGTETQINGVPLFAMPIEVAAGIHISQRNLGQSFSFEIVDDGAALPVPADIPVVGLYQINSTTLTVETEVPHGLMPGRCIGIAGALDPRVSYPEVVVASIPSPTLLTITAWPGLALPTTQSYFSAVLAATTAPLPANSYANGTAGVGATMTASANGGFPAIDAVAVPVGGRVLVKNEATAANNGIYVLTSAGSAGAPWVLTRAADFDTAAEMTVAAATILGVAVHVQQGAVEGLKKYVLAASVATVGTNAVTWNDLGAVGVFPLNCVIYPRSRLGQAQNGVSQIFEGASAVAASFYVRSESGDVLPSGTVAASQAITTGSTASIQLAANLPYTNSLSPSVEFRQVVQADRVQWSDMAIDSVTQSTSRLVRQQVCPDPDAQYKIRIRATNMRSLTVPRAQIISVSKTGSTTATCVTDVPHGLLPGDLVLAYGTRDQTNFANLTAATAVASVIDATTFTIVWGAAVTATTRGGFIARLLGQAALPGAVAQSIQSATLATLVDGRRQLTLVGSAAWAAPATTIGELVEIIGVRADAVGSALLGVDGPWEIANVGGTSLVLLLPAPRNLPADFAFTNCGGGVVRRSDFRLSYVRVFPFLRQRVEMLPRPINDIAGAAPVSVQNVPSVLVSGAPSVNQAFMGIVADVASAALTASTTVAAIAPTTGVSYQVNIPVTAVSGTSPTLDVGIEESDDTGTNWFRVYDFARITAAGMYRSPVLPVRGNRVRYVQTVGGTSPSFTRAINRLQSNDPVVPIRQRIERGLDLSSTGSATTALNTRDCVGPVQLVVNLGAATTPPSFQLEGSEDNGATWYAIGAALAGLANNTVQITVPDVNAALLRARVSVAGVGATLGYVLVKAGG